MSERKVHPLQRAWASGVLDARISFPQKGYVLRFDSTDDGLMHRFYETVGVGRLERHVKGTDGKRTPFVSWAYRTTNMDQTRDLLLFVSPFLSPRRLKQAGQLVAKIERNNIWRKNHPEKVPLSET